MPENRPGRKYETESQRTGRQFIHFYMAPVVIAIGLVIAGTSAVEEGKRIKAGEFNTVPEYVKQQEGGEDLSSWEIDANLIELTVVGGVFMGGGIWLRRYTRNENDNS